MGSRPARSTAHIVRRGVLDMTLQRLSIALRPRDRVCSQRRRATFRQETSPVDVSRLALNEFVQEMGPNHGSFAPFWPVFGVRVAKPRAAHRSPNARTPTLAGVLGVELGGLEPPTSWVRSRRPHRSNVPDYQPLWRLAAARATTCDPRNLRPFPPGLGQREPPLARRTCPRLARLAAPAPRCGGAMTITLSEPVSPCARRPRAVARFTLHVGGPAVS